MCHCFSSSASPLHALSLLHHAWFKLTPTPCFFLCSCTRSRFLHFSLSGSCFHLALGFSGTTGSAPLQVRAPKSLNKPQEQLAGPKLGSQCPAMGWGCLVLGWLNATWSWRGWGGVPRGEVELSPCRASPVPSKWLNHKVCPRGCDSRETQQRAQSGICSFLWRSPAPCQTDCLKHPLICPKS